MNRFFSVILMLSVVFASACAFAAGPVVVDAEGVAIKSEAYDVRRQAIDDSLRNAVRSAVETVTRQEGMKYPASQALAEVSAKPSAYVLSYKILSEGWMTHFDISPEAAAEALGPAQTAQNAAATASLEAASLGVEAYHIRVNASIDAKTLYADLASLAGGPAVAPAQVYAITLTDMTDYAVYSGAASVIEASPEIKDFDYRTFYRGKITLTAASFLSGPALAERLARELGPDFAVELTGSHEISIKPVSTLSMQNEAQ